MRNKLSLIFAVALVALIAVPLSAAVKVSVVHAVPGVTVDVYANGGLLLGNFKPENGDAVR